MKSTIRWHVSEKEIFQDWFKKHRIEDVEAIVPDMAGAARGKLLPADKFGSGDMKMPEAVFAQTISGEYVINASNVEETGDVRIDQPSRPRRITAAITNAV